MNNRALVVVDIQNDITKLAYYEKQGCELINNKICKNS